MADLGTFLASQLHSTEPWNCSTMPADWCMVMGHADFASRWRDTVEPLACDMAATCAGGLLPLWDADIGDALPAVEGPRAGDIAVVEVLGIETGAICTGGRWALKGQRGLHILGADQIRVLKAWRP